MGSDVETYETFRHWIDAAVHELPSGVLWGARGPTPEECAEMLEGLAEFEGLCRRLGLAGHSDYIDDCRWHFDHYPHYLSRRRHFTDYESYVRTRRGPVHLVPPPSPWRGKRKLRPG